MAKTVHIRDGYSGSDPNTYSSWANMVTGEAIYAGDIEIIVHDIATLPTTNTIALPWNDIVVRGATLPPATNSATGEPRLILTGLTELLIKQSITFHSLRIDGDGNRLEFGNYDTNANVNVSNVVMADLTLAISASGMEGNFAITYSLANIVGYDNYILIDANAASDTTVNTTGTIQRVSMLNANPFSELISFVAQALSGGVAKVTTDCINVTALRLTGAQKCFAKEFTGDGATTITVNTKHCTDSDGSIANLGGTNIAPLTSVPALEFTSTDDLRWRATAKGINSGFSTTIADFFGQSQSGIAEDRGAFEFVVGSNVWSPQARCKCTIVQNIGDSPVFFGFIPPHGKILEPGESTCVVGDLYEYLVKLTPNERAWKSLERALLQCVIRIVNTPAPILEGEAGAYNPALDGSTLITLPSCWDCN